MQRNAFHSQTSPIPPPILALLANLGVESDSNCLGVNWIRPCRDCWLLIADCPLFAEYQSLQCTEYFICHTSCRYRTWGMGCDKTATATVLQQASGWLSIMHLVTVVALACGVCFLRARILFPSIDLLSTSTAMT